MYKVLVCGGTGWGRPGPIRREIKRLIKKHGDSKLLIIEGKAEGADTIAGEMAKELNVHVCEVGALWNTRYRSAGPQRNDVMLALEPDEIIAFHTDLKKSKGTKDTVTKARKRGIPTKVVDK